MPPAPRPQFYVHVHKAIRNALGQFSIRSGATCYDDDVAVRSLVGEVSEIAEMLRAHAKNEERNIHPLLREINAPAEQLEAAHVEVDAGIDKLAALSAQVAAMSPTDADRPQVGLQLYRASVAFQAFYINHMIDEEQKFLPMLIEAFPPERIAATREKVIAGSSFEVIRTVVRYQMPALNAHDRIEVMKAYQKRATPPEFAAFCATARGVLAHDEWAAICAGVGIDDNAPVDDSRIEEILRYWFGDEPDDPNILSIRAPFWMANPQNRPVIDLQIRRRFGIEYERACRGALNRWADTPRGRLALVVVLDQFSRNLYRDDPRAFAQDQRALQLTQEGIARGDDKQLRFIERMFFYMPLMHSETLETQRMSVECFSRLVEEAPENMRAGFEKVVGKAKEHLRCVERFGRYPHRNAILGRTSTPAEDAFLATEPQPGRGAEGTPPAHVIHGGSA